MAALEFAFVFVFLGVGGVLLFLFGALSFHFHWKDLLDLKQRPPLERGVLERFMQRPVPGDPNEGRIRKLQNDYEQMVQFRQSTLLGAMGFDVCILALGLFGTTQAHPRKIRAAWQVRHGPNARKGPNYVQQDPQSRAVRLILLAASAGVLAGCVLAFIPFRIESARVQESPPLEPMTLDFYMPEPARDSADASMVRKIQRDYAMLQESHQRHLGATLVVLAMPFSACVLVMLYQLLWLWPRKPQPQPQIENTAA